MPAKTYLTCIGTRPEIIKMAVLHRLLTERGHRTVVLHTGQHEAVAHALYEFFDMRPDIVIDLQRKSPGLGHLTAAMMERVDAVIDKVDPDVVLVQGDTTSALVGALSGYYHHKPVAHIEAGLRTHVRDPFPEEKNRELVGRLAHWHFPPTPQARINLLNEGVGEARIFEVGNTVIDAALWTRVQLGRPSFAAQREPMPGPLRQFLERFAQHRMILITAHRRENWGEPIRNIARAAAAVLSRNPQAVAVWPVHPNPAVRADVEAELCGVETLVRRRICLTEPLNYPVLIELLARCHFTLTDSGGIQEEASALAKPVLIARNSTERQELVLAGGAVLVGTEVGRMMKCSQALLNDPAAYRGMQLKQSPFGDGRAAERIADVLATVA